MRRVIIRNIGALKDVDIQLSDINVFIGPQSLGKSTLLKICSYCAWVEKRIQLSQDYSSFAAQGGLSVAGGCRCLTKDGNTSIEKEGYIPYSLQA